MTYLKTEKTIGRIRNRPIKDYSGCVFGRLTAVSLVERDVVENNHLWLFRCTCGTERTLKIRNVRGGRTRSCGCLFSETVARRNTTHGLSRKHPREYRTWKDMRARCNSPARTDFKDYGGRGITVCPRWDSFEAFFKDMGTRPTGLAIDRVEVNGNYEPGNCRWATDKTQANNKRTNRVIVIDGESRTLQEWCSHFGVDHSKARYRLKQGWNMKDVFSSDDFRR